MRSQQHASYKNTNFMKHSQLDTPVPLAAMCCTETGFQNGDCTCPYNVGLGNQGNEAQIFAFKETIDVLSECHFSENMLLMQYTEAWELT